MRKQIIKVPDVMRKLRINVTHDGHTYDDFGKSMMAMMAMNINIMIQILEHNTN